MNFFPQCANNILYGAFQVNRSGAYTLGYADIKDVELRYPEQGKDEELRSKVIQASLNAVARYLQ